MNRCWAEFKSNKKSRRKLKNCRKCHFSLYGPCIIIFLFFNFTNFAFMKKSFEFELRKAGRRNVNNEFRVKSYLVLSRHTQLNKYFIWRMDNPLLITYTLQIALIAFMNLRILQAIFCTYNAKSSGILLREVQWLNLLHLQLLLITHPNANSMFELPFPRWNTDEHCKASRNEFGLKFNLFSITLRAFLLCLENESMRSNKIQMKIKKFL